MSSDYISIATVFLISALIGLTIVKVVEARMTDISINMPTIKFPQQQITVQIQEEDLGTGLGSKITKKEGIVVYNSLDTIRSVSDIPDMAQSESQTGGSAKPISEEPGSVCKEALNGSLCKESGLVAECGKRMENRASWLHPKHYNEQSKPVPRPVITVPDPSSTYGQHSYPAPYPRATPSLKEPKPVLNGETYYLDPKKMTKEQLIKFQQRAKFEHMTVQDYQNWLMTFRDNAGRLNGFHRVNLKVLLRGGQLNHNDMPQRTSVPDDAMDQYTNIMYGQISDTPNPEYLGYQPYNYEDQLGYPAAVANRDLRHLDYVNPDEPMKTWIITRDSSRLTAS
jgi:hypothetical protein